MKLKKLGLIAFVSISLLALSSCKIDTSESKKANNQNTGSSTAFVTSTNKGTTTNKTSNPTSTPTSNPTISPTSTSTGNPTISPTSTSKVTPTNPTDAPNDSILPTGGGKVETETTVKFLSVLGEYESAYVEFKCVEDATAYNFYLTGGKYKSTTKVDSSIVYYRLVNGVIRADFLGLEAGEYTVEVKPVINNIEDENTGSTAKFTVVAYDRSGYAHFKYNEGVGAYNSDGTLKNNAIVM